MIDFALYLVTDRKLTGYRSLEDVIEEACTAGVRAVQLRERDLNAEELFRLGKRIHLITRKYNTSLFINDRIDVAKAIGAEGVHLRETSLPVNEARRLLEPDMMLGVSVHSIENAIAAYDNGADFLVFGTIFHTQSKPGTIEPVGTDAIIHLTQKVDIPVFVIGGITPERTRVCIEAGAHGVAVISAIMESHNITETINQFKNQLITL